MKTRITLLIKTGITAILVSTLLIFVSCGNRQSKSTGENGSSVAQTRPQPPAMDIHTATVTGDLKVIQKHISAGSDLNSKDPVGGSTPLITAIVFGKTEVAGALIDAGADINSTNNEGSTPLYCAAFFGRTDLVRLLLDKGADKNTRNIFGSTALESVSIPFNNIKGVYDQVSKDLGPFGFKLDYNKLEETRPIIADMLR
ncbi:MAG: ankyrin repeat domain-containing protein [Bacteroidetes bacterium]|nr:ankyrin repeat domain-containing protein [Bacteroidota bacterium]